MIDIHSHILPFVDDGSEDLDTSLNMLKESVNLGVTDVILTPHLRRQYNCTKEQLNVEFDKFRRAVKKENIPVNIYLGQEIYISNDYKKLFLEHKIVPMNGTKFVLIEFDFLNEMDIADIVYEVKMLGYIPIVAHVERYFYSDIDTCFEVKDLGGYIQVNADSIVGKNKAHYRKLIKELFKNNLVDFVASDIHSVRVNYLKQAELFLTKKIGKDATDKIFNQNPKIITEGQTQV